LRRGEKSNSHAVRGGGGCQSRENWGKGGGGKARAGKTTDIRAPEGGGDECQSEEKSRIPKGGGALEEAVSGEEGTVFLSGKEEGNRKGGVVPH